MKTFFRAAAVGLAVSVLAGCASAPGTTAPSQSAAANRDNCVMLTGSRVCRDPSKVAGDVTILSPKAMREQPNQTSGGLGSLTPSN